MVATLALEDGTVAVGASAGARGTITGEVVFNTAHCGYQEILTDPSYCRQIVVMTCPQIGNYGVNDRDVESSRPQAAGLVMREASRRHSNPHAVGGLEAFLTSNGMPAISEVDTRAITRRIRDAGALRGVLSTEVMDADQLVEMARKAPVMEGCNLTHDVIGSANYTNTATGAQRVVVLDCGVKTSILRMIAAAGMEPCVLPGDTTANQVMANRPACVVVGNGPGDPGAVTQTIETIKALVDQVPLLGICLGHQMIALALGATTYKLKFGHHGSNHPVLNHGTGRVEITSQNHGFAVDKASLAHADLEVTHTNLYDGTVEGFAHRTRPIFAVQFHPEAGPGPHDASGFFLRVTQPALGR